MISITKVNIIRDGKEVVEGTCLSSDTKPTGYGNGSVLMEMDTSTLYMYDEANQTWRAW